MSSNLKIIIWAGAQHFYKFACALSEDSDQPAHWNRPISLRCPPEDPLILGCKQSALRKLIRPSGCAGWSCRKRCAPAHLYYELVGWVLKCSISTFWRNWVSYTVGIRIECSISWSALQPVINSSFFCSISSRKHTYIILTPLNPTFT